MVHKVTTTTGLTVTRGFLFIPSFAVATVSTDNGKVPSGTIEIREGSTVVKRLNVVLGVAIGTVPSGRHTYTATFVPSDAANVQPEHERTGQHPLTGATEARVPLRARASVVLRGRGTSRESSATTTDAALGRLLADAREAQPLVERERLRVRRLEVDLARHDAQTELAGARVDRRVERAPDAAAVRGGRDDDAVDVQRARHVRGEPAVVLARVLRAGRDGEHETERSLAVVLAPRARGRTPGRARSARPGRAR